MQVDPVEFDTASGWAIRIYEKMKEDLEAKKIETWHHGYDKLMDCSLCVVERGCCKKRKLMLAMTSQILDWLEQHQHKLSDIDFGDDETVAMSQEQKARWMRKAERDQLARGSDVSDSGGDFVEASHAKYLKR